ncbi:MAG: hypothetical protein ACI4HI_05710 [Lachnospiraceae bacterium]
MAEIQQETQKTAAYMQKKARQEAEGVRYVREKIDWKDPKLVAQVYENLLKQNMFETPVGLEFLAEMRRYLDEQKEKENKMEIEREKIRKTAPKPNFITPDGKESAVESLQEDISEKGIETARMFANQVSEMKTKKAAEIRREKRQPITLQKEKKWLHVSVAGNVFLIIIILLMFWISSTSENPTILDYETKIINKYENWESQLQQKEHELKQREKKMNEEEENIRKREEYLENGNED